MLKITILPKHNAICRCLFGNKAKAKIFKTKNSLNVNSHQSIFQMPRFDRLKNSGQKKTIVQN